MKIKAGYKLSLFLAALITAGVLCTLPFLLVNKETIYVYTEHSYPTGREIGFIRELKQKNMRVVVNSSVPPTPNDYGLWFKNPEYVEQISKSKAKINFLYTEAYYPFAWHGLKKLPVVLTPYREIYEHYMRSNIKSAIMNLGVDNTKFYSSPVVRKKYPLIYYGDNNKFSPVADYLQNISQTKFLGSFWQDNKKTLAIDLSNPDEIRETLKLSQIVVVYNAPDSPLSKRVPPKVMEATLSGALVFSSPNPSITETYKENIVIYESLDDFIFKLEYYLKNIDNYQNFIFSAQKITAENFNSSATVQRFMEIFDWLKKNTSN